jgi:hypothetical protein
MRATTGIVSLDPLRDLQASLPVRANGRGVCMRRPERNTASRQA